MTATIKFNGDAAMTFVRHFPPYCYTYLPQQFIVPSTYSAINYINNRKTRKIIKKSISAFVYTRGCSSGK